MPPQNLMPMQPMNFNNPNPQYRTPMSITQPTPLQQYPAPMQYPYVSNPMPIPQPFSPPITVPNLNLPPFSPAPTIRVQTATPGPPNSGTSSDLMDRMRQVQLLMIEINRLEGESRDGNYQRLQELKQRVAELSATDMRTGPGMASAPDAFPSQPPPAYPLDVKHL